MASLAPLRVSLARPRLVAVAHRARSIARNAPTVTTPAGQRAAASLSRRGLCAQAAADTPGAGVVTENNTTAPGSESGDADTLSTSYENGTIDLLLSTEEARKTLQFDKVTLSQQQGSVIFVTGVAIGSAAEAAGVTPGQRLVALSDPITAGQLWFLGGTERLAFVLDAIKSTRAYEMTIIFESEAGRGLGRS
jgi:hypothetical protein